MYRDVLYRDKTYRDVSSLYPYQEWGEDDRTSWVPPPTSYYHGGAPPQPDNSQVTRWRKSIRQWWLLYPTWKQENAWTQRKMGSTQGRGVGGGASPPSKEQDNQLISNSGGDETPKGQPRRQEDKSNMTSRTHHAQYIVLWMWMIIICM
jgi:hypothetical protein